MAIVGLFVVFVFGMFIFEVWPLRSRLRGHCPREKRGYGAIDKPYMHTRRAVDGQVGL